MHPPPPLSTLFPYTTLFRSASSNADFPHLSPCTPPDAQEPRYLVRYARIMSSLGPRFAAEALRRAARNEREDRKSTRLNSSHVSISYAVFCLKKKNKTIKSG